MIGFNALGQLGRLGNQMFQFAAVKGIAKNRGYEYCFPPSRNLNEWTDHQLFNLFKLSATTSLNIQFIDVDRPTIVETGFEFDDNLFHNCPDWVNIQGFFQSEKYFKHIEDEIRSDFDFHDELLIPAKNISSQWREPIALHIRRTDYLTNPNHSELPMSYYEKALTEFDKNRDVIIFSDDPDWCMANQLFDSDRFMVSQTENNHMDLCLMSLCKDHIIANSSFSWWGAWLGKNNQVIAPKNWFLGSNNHHLNVSDLIPDNWKKI